MYVSWLKNIPFLVGLRTFQHVFLYIYIYMKPFPQARYDTRSILKWSLKGLNSEFFFSHTNCHTKVIELSLPYYLPIARGKIVGFILFISILALWKCKYLCPGFELGSPCSFPTTIAITLQVPSYSYILK